MKQVHLKGKSVILVIITVIVLCVCSFLWLIRSSMQSSRSTALQISDLYLNELTTNTIGHFHTSVENNFSNLNTIAAVAQHTELNGEDALQNFLSTMKETYHLAFLAFVDAQGRYYSEEGVFPAASKVSFLGELLLGGKNLISYDETVLGDNMLLLGTSFNEIDYQGIQFAGILIGLEKSSLSTQLSLERERSNTFSSIVTAAGSYIINNGGNALPQGANVFTQLEKFATFEEGYSIEQMRENFSAGQSAIACYTLNEQRHYVYYMPISGTDWFMLTTISYSLVNEHVENLSSKLMKNTVSVFLLTIGLLLTLFIIYYIVMSRKERELTKANTLAEDAKAQAEQALQIARIANRSKSAFLSNMSHDIRTPMNAIVGLSTMLTKDAADSKRVKDHARKITSSSQYLLSLINDVLDMSKIESGKTTLNISEINLAEIIDEIGTIMRPQAKAKQQEFEIAVIDLRNEHVLGDKLRINQILINLLSNAVKYTQPGGHVLLKIKQLTQDRKNYAQFQFIVEDNGYGMSEEYQKVLFDPFTREANSITGKVQGTGLGMAITKNLIDLMGGTITVQSTLDKGSTFTIDLGLRLQDFEINQEFWINHGITHALIVDDEVEVCTSILGAMSGTGVAVQYAVDGRTAVSMTEKAYASGRGFDLVLLDWKMPELDGIETARRIRKAIPEHITIMLLTAFDWNEIEEDALEAGIDGFLPKLFFLTNFKQTVEFISKKNGTGPEVVEEEKTSILDGMHFLAAEDNMLNSEILTELLQMKGA